jgi:NTP pyrophosphatase (non-canonical NTP hydrolase)
MIKQVFETGERLPKRTRLSVLCSLVEEVGELSTEVSISEGLSYKTEGPDGVIGEAVDVLICALDIIKVHKPEITEEEIIKLVQDKCAKWKRKSLEVK